jgi:glycosyltransferase involved in cell wall biosynthesis
MRLSVILPCRNEVRHLARCLDSLLNGTWPQDSLEILVVDGESDDGSVDVAVAHAERHPVIRILANPRRSAPAALNIGLAAATGDVIVRVDAHVEYPGDYLERLVAQLVATGADNVGGRVETIPGAPTIVGRAIARAMSHPFGVGNSRFRLRSSSPSWVDTVPFGCFRRDVFTRLGEFDEELIRNQDDEFNARITRAGGRILLDPSIVARYVARPRLRQLARMYHQYGVFKPLVVRRIGAVTSARQLAPVTLLVVLAGCAAAGLVHPAAWRAGLSILVLYLVAALAAAAHAAREDGIRGIGARAWAFAVMHLSYGAGYLRGLVRLMHPPSPGTPHQLVPLSRGDA